MAEQRRIPGVFTGDAFTAARFLLKPSRGCEQAVAAFSPYKQTKEIDDEARGAAAELIRRHLELAGNETKCATFVLVNNRLEDNALFTILGILQRLGLVD